MSDTVPASRVGTQFGPYRLRRLLGRGGMGEVYEAYDTVKDRTVALKLMSQQFNSDAVFRRRMQREAHTAGRLQEPHIVPIHDFGEIDGQLFIDMRFVQGTDLGSLLSREGALPPPRAVAIISQVAEALDAAHGAGVVHRDIKPENILITSTDFAYLVDFGIAAAATDEHQLTKTGTAVGSWSYMAPERFRDDDVTYRSDIYALTCVLYECLTGTPPYEAQNLSALMGAHLLQPIPRPSQQRPGISSAFDEVVARGMAKDPERRYPSAGQLARAAQDALSVPERRHAVTLIEHSEQSAPLPSGPIPWAQPPPPSPPQWPPAAASKHRPWLVVGAVLAIVAVVIGAAIWLVLNNNGRGHAAAHHPTTTGAAAIQPDSILLSPEQLGSIVGAATMRVIETMTQMVNPKSSVTPEECLGALSVIQVPAYAGSGYTAVKAELVQQGTNPNYGVAQGAVIYDSADKALAFVQRSATTWQSCSGKTVTEIRNGQTYKWTFGSFTGSPSKIALSRVLLGANGWDCPHQLSAVSNVVLDVALCGQNTDDHADEIATAMAAKVPR